MKFVWNEEKNELLKQKRGISFEEISCYIKNGHVIKDIKHPNKDKYPNQRIY